MTDLSRNPNLHDTLRARGYRITPQRQLVLDAVVALQHGTPDDICAEVQRTASGVNLTTVYRTLPLLTESGLVREMDFGKDYKFYDPNYAEHPNHNHIICNDCEKIVEFESDKIAKIESEITQKLGFAIKAQKLQITATCEELKKAGTCKNKCH